MKFFDWCDDSWKDQRLSIDYQERKKDDGKAYLSEQITLDGGLFTFTVMSGKLEPRCRYLNLLKFQNNKYTYYLVARGNIVVLGVEKTEKLSAFEFEDKIAFFEVFVQYSMSMEMDLFKI